MTRLGLLSLSLLTVACGSEAALPSASGDSPSIATRGEALLGAVVSLRELAGPEPKPPPPKPPPKPVMPAGDKGFQGGDDSANQLPPDSDGAVGPNHVVTAHNGLFRVQTRDGTLESSVSLATFWAKVTVANVFDPKVLYLPFDDRFVITTGTDDHSPASALLVGISNTPDPGGTWSQYRIDADPNQQLWVDYPSIGFNKSWVAVNVNVYHIVADAFAESRVYVFDKAALLVGGGKAPYTVLADAVDGAIMVPAQTYDPALADLYLVQTWNGNSSGMGSMRVYRISGAVGAEKMSPVGLATDSAPWARSAPGFADFAPQLGSPHLIDAGDDRTEGVVFRNGTLWAAHTVFLPADAPVRSAAQFWQIATDGKVLQRGRVDDPSGAQFFAYATIGVNHNDDALLGYSRFSATQYASADYAFRLGTDPPGTLQGDTVFKAGLAPYYKTQGGPSNRWGDFSATMVDPKDDTALWTIQEYAEQSAGGQDRWGTWWTRVVPAPCAAEGKSCDSGDTCTQNGTCKAGVCVGSTPTVCKPVDACHLAGACLPATGACTSPVSADGAPCPGGVCAQGVCTAAADAGPGTGGSGATGTTSASAAVGSATGGGGSSHPPASSPASGGCGCRTAPSSSSSEENALLGFAFLAVSRRRRREGARCR